MQSGMRPEVRLLVSGTTLHWLVRAVALSFRAFPFGRSPWLWSKTAPFPSPVSFLVLVAPQGTNVVCLSLSVSRGRPVYYHFGHWVGLVCPWLTRRTAPLFVGECGGEALHPRLLF